MPQNQPVDDWVDVNDWEDTEPEAIASSIFQSPTKAKPADSGFLSSVWSAINEPLINLSLFGRQVSDAITEPSLSDADSYWMPRLKGFTGGAIEGLSDVVSSFTSPLNVATAGSLGAGTAAASKGLPAIGRGLTTAGKGLSALVAGHGASEVVDPESTPAERLFGVTEIAGGLAGIKTPRPTTGKAKVITAADEVKPPVTAEVAKAAEVPAKVADPEIAASLEKFGLEPKPKAPVEKVDPVTGEVTIEGIPPELQRRPRKRELKLHLDETKAAEAARIEASLNARMQKLAEGDVPPPEGVPAEISRIAAESTAVKDQPGLLERALGLNKAILTSTDVSAPGRQGKAFILNKEWWTSLDDMVKAWGSKTAADNIHQSIVEHPSGFFKPSVAENGKIGKSFAETVGLELADTEEFFNSTYGKAARKYLGVNKSSRAHTAFLNKLRSDVFVSFMKDAETLGMNPKQNLELAKSYARFINNATGRGSLNVGSWKLEASAKALNDVFFAPRNMSGQIRTWNAVLNPVSYANYDPVLRKQALKSLFAIAGTGSMFTGLLGLAGAQTSLNPTNPDFMKTKIGKDVRIDPFGGYQQYPVAAAKLLTGESTSSVSGRTTDLTAGRYGQQTRASVAERFFINRLAPLPSFIWAWMNNREFDGKPFEVKRAIYERVLPIAMKDIAELAAESPELAAVLAPTTLMGLTGTQVYSGR